LKNKDNISQKMGSSQNKNNSLTKSQLKSRDEKEDENNLIKKYEIKIVLLGDINVGKTSIVLRYSKNIFKNHYPPTIRGAYTQKNLLLQNGILIKFHIWDTSGQERYRTMSKLYYLDAEAIILVYDISNEESVINLKYWIQEIKNNVNIYNIILAIAANKCDIKEIDGKVDIKKGKKFADDNNLIFYETSALKGIGIEKMFYDIGNKYYDMKMKK
jgi:Ras-related protein Rab-5C